MSLKLAAFGSDTFQLWRRCFVLERCERHAFVFCFIGVSAGWRPCEWHYISWFIGADDMYGGLQR